MTVSRVYSFGPRGADGTASMRTLLGGKGANLAEMALAGVPVPPGFTVSTQVCNMYLAGGNRVPDEVEAEMAAALRHLESDIGKKLGDATNPLLLSVRSGAKFSMPGMMDTILNLGLNDSATEGLAALSGKRTFALDCYRRFIMMFADVVMDVSKGEFEEILEDIKEAAGAENDMDLNADQLAEVVEAFKAHYKKSLGDDFPQDAQQQLKMARDAVFRSWDNPRANHYRRMNDIPHDLGTAVNVQAMVFGNLGETSATGVGFTRDPATGANEFYGEFLVNAQGEDVVAGIRTPRPIDELKTVLPEAYGELVDCARRVAAQLGGDVTPMEILIDAPPVDREVEFRVQIYFPKESLFRPLASVSPVVEALAKRQFDDYVKRVRVFVHPERLSGFAELGDLSRELTEAIQRME